jgi:hypothetical protein
LAAWILVILPFLLVRLVARVLSIAAATYYVCCGAVTGALLCALHEFVGWRLRAGEELPWPDHATGIVSYCLAGALGGLVFWWIGVRTRSVSPPH